MTGRGRLLLLLALGAAWLLLPLNLGDDWLRALNYAAVTAIAATGLNLLTGYTGQVSLGHAAFLGCGAYVTAWFGVEQELSMLTWLPVAAAVGALVGALVGPFALRLRGDYLAVVTIGLLFVAEHLFENWDSVTGGGSGTRADAPLDVGGLRFDDLELLGRTFTREQGMFWFLWAVAAAVVVLLANLVRTRAGRALQAIRDRDVAAEVIGIDLARYKIAVFALSGAATAVAGALYGSLQQVVSPTQFGGIRGLFTSIEYIAAIVVGGMGTVGGGAAGAILLACTGFLIRQHGSSIPITSWEIGGQELLPPEILDQILYGVLIIIVLVVQPGGLAGLWRQVHTRVRARGAST